MFHAPEMFMGKAFKGEAVVCYCEPLITQPMDVSGSAHRVKSFLFFIIYYKDDWMGADKIGTTDAGPGIPSITHHEKIS